MNSKAFSNAFSSVLKLAHNVFTKLSPGGSTFTESSHEAHLEDGGKIRVEPARRVPYQTLAFWIRGSIQGTPEYQGLSELLGQDQLIGRHLVETVGSRFGRQKIREHGLIQDILAEYVRCKGSFARDGRIISRIFRHLKKHFESNVLTTEFTAYLENTCFYSNRIRLSPTTRIISLTEEDVVECFNSRKHVREFYSDRRWAAELSKVRASVVVTFDEPKTFGKKIPSGKSDASNLGRSQVFRVINALRIMVASQVCVSPIVQRTHFFPFENYEYPLGYNEYQSYLSTAYFDPEHDKQLVELFNNMESAEQEYPALSHVWNRLDLLNSRRFTEDRVIDLFICLEFILRACVPKEIKTNSESMALFLTNLAGRSKAERDYIFETVVEAYKVRNRIIHALKPKKKEDEIIDRLARILRQSLRNIILQT